MRAFVAREVKVLYVTHMFDLADGFYRLNMGDALFLRAERLGDGQRAFRLSVADHCRQATVRTCIARFLARLLVESVNRPSFDPTSFVKQRQSQDKHQKHPDQPVIEIQIARLQNAYFVGCGSHQTS